MQYIFKYIIIVNTFVCIKNSRIEYSYNIKSLSLILYFCSVSILSRLKYTFLNLDKIPKHHVQCTLRIKT